MKKVKIKAGSWFARIAAAKLRSTQVAIVLGNTIHLYNVSPASFLNNRRWLMHELMHVHQFQQHGYMRFLFLYFFEYLRNGYHKNKYELEAKNAETDESLLEKYEIPGY